MKYIYHCSFIFWILLLISCQRVFSDAQRISPTAIETNTEIDSSTDTESFVSYLDTNLSYSHNRPNHQVPPFTNTLTIEKTTHFTLNELRQHQTNSGSSIIQPKSLSSYPVLAHDGNKGHLNRRNNGLANDLIHFKNSQNETFIIVGLNDGISIVNVTDKQHPSILKFFNLDQMYHSSWRDFVAIGDVVYGVSEGGGGFYILDLTESQSPSLNLFSTGIGFSTAHNISADPDRGYLFVSGANNDTEGSIMIFDTSNPLAPTYHSSIRDGYPTEMFTTDSNNQVQRYSHFSHHKKINNKDYLFDSNETELIIWDITDINQIAFVSMVQYWSAYIHSSTISEDNQYLYIQDELSTVVNQSNNQAVVNISDISQPKIEQLFCFSCSSSIHHAVIHDHYLLTSHYTEGLVVLDMSIPTQPIGVYQFDTFPEHDHNEFDGAWGVTIDQVTRHIFVSDISSGLFIFTWDF